MQNLYTRTITGIIFVALIIGSLILHPLAFVFLFYFVMVIALMEFFHLANDNEVFPQKALGLTAGSIVYFIHALIALEKISVYYLAFLPLLIIFIFITEFFRNKPNPIQNVAFSIFPIAYISIPLSMMIFLMGPMATGGQPHWHIAFSFFIILWSHDTFAYLTGKATGKHKLFEKISPNKTWEGTTGGMIFGLIAAFILSLFFKELSTWQWIGGALIIMVTGTFGDLSESLLKRRFNVKDSGHFLPGHGGMLDRIDSVLFSAPAFCCYLLLLNL